METIQTTLHSYRFNIENEEEKNAYQLLTKQLKDSGLKLFDSISGASYDKHKAFRNLIESVNGKTIELETEHLFDNQWNTAPIEGSKTGLRVFDWSEEIFPNKRIKEGYYLDQVPDMLTIRQDTKKCEYCGKNHYKTDLIFCDSCVGGEYLTEDQLHLLQLQPIKGKKSDKVAVPDSLIQLNAEKRKAFFTEKLKKQQADKIKSIEKDISNSKIELEAFQLLIDNNIDYENCIFYSHQNSFCFGWRSSIADKGALKQSLEACGFSEKFNYTIK